MAVLPDHQHTTGGDLLVALHDRDVLAFVELYQRTAPAAHAVARRLLSSRAHVEAALHDVYSNLWLAPPQTGPVGQWVRARCFAVASADLRRRGAAPAEPSLVTILDGLPAPSVSHLTKVERALADLPERLRRAVLLAHDAGVPSKQQADPEAGESLEAGLLALSDIEPSPDGFVPSKVEGLGDWALGLLSDGDAEALAAAVAADAQLSARVTALRMARRRLEGLPATPNTSQRILAHVLATAPAPRAEVIGLAPATTQQRRSRTGVGLVAASLVLVLLAGVLVLTSRAPGSPQIALAQAAAPTAAPTEAAPAPAEPAPVPRRARQRARDATPRIVPPARIRRQVEPAAPPVRVAVPKMNVDKRLVGLGVLNDGTLAAPDDYGIPGWFRDGVVPGDVGPAVIVGHVDSLDGPAVFYDLQKLRRGDKAFVKRADGTTATFVIDRVERYAKDAFPTDKVYGPTLGPELRLITCGGAFDNTTLSYDDNVVAFAHLLQPRSRSPKDQRGRKDDAGGRQTQQQQKKKKKNSNPTPSYDHLGRLREPADADGQDDKTRNTNRARRDAAADA